MVAFLAAGVILGVLTRTLRQGPGDRPLRVTVTVVLGLVEGRARWAG